MSRNPPEVHKHGARKVTETSVIRFCHRSETLLLSRSQALKFLLLSREKTVHFANTSAITHLLQCLFNLTQRIKLEIKRARLQNQEPCRPLTLQSVMILEGLASNETKTSEGLLIFHFGK